MAKNARLGVNNSPQYLEHFFRNLLMGEQMPLNNRDLHISNKDVQNAETEQVPNKRRTSTGQVQDNTIRLVQTMGVEKLSIKEIMAAIGLKGRDNFLNLYLNPAIENGFVRLLYPDSPRHPRQKYLLTVKGMMMYNQLSNK